LSINHSVAFFVDIFVLLKLSSCLWFYYVIFSFRLRYCRCLPSMIFLTLSSWTIFDQFDSFGLLCLLDFWVFWTLSILGIFKHFKSFDLFYLFVTFGLIVNLLVEGFSTFSIYMAFSTLYYVISWHFQLNLATLRLKWVLSVSRKLNF